MLQVVFITKTNLNNDGRILNELKILKDYYKNRIKIDFILMPDKPLTSKVEAVSNFHILHTRIRNNKFLRPLTVLDFTQKALRKLKQIHPRVIHVQDAAVVLPVLLYKRYVDKTVRVIYDDHELPNENEGVSLRIYKLFENKLMRISNSIITANEERLNYLSQNNPSFPSEKAIFFLNLPYFETILAQDALTLDTALELKATKNKHAYRYLMHQGVIEKERGREKLAELSKIIPENYRILILGVSLAYFKEFIEEFDLVEASFVFIGIVPYSALSEYWSLADASVIMYLPTYINNRLCAPNRLYLSFLNAIPIIVNKDNPVLSNFIVNHNCGVFVESLTNTNLDEELSKISYSNTDIESLKSTETSKLIQLYRTELNFK